MMIIVMKTLMMHKIGTHLLNRHKPTCGHEHIQPLIEVNISFVQPVIMHQHMLRPVCGVLVVFIQGGVAN